MPEVSSIDQAYDDLTKHIFGVFFQNFTDAASDASQEAQTEAKFRAAILHARHVRDRTILAAILEWRDQMNLRLWLAIAMAASPVVGVAQNQLPPAYVKLVRATNYVQELRSNPARISDEDAALATKLACDGLREAASDGELRKRVSNTAAAASEYDAGNSEARRNLNLFLDEFLSPELIILERAGLSPAAIRQIVVDSRTLKAQAYIGKYGKGSAEPFLKSLDELTDEICRAAAQAKSIIEKQASDKLFRVGVGTAGALIVVADLYLTVPTGLLAVQSYSFGAAFVTGAILK